ncbi:MAG: helix-hairpin-helix domain-containing protein [Candidatus Omnitrophica bacterium]|nr:helix-hairpin-helix domain-containing protein [Candidatus Omnitrophota bacterium]
MFHLTKEERLVVIYFGATLILGSLFYYVFKQNPNLWNLINVVDSQKIYPKVDINRADRDQLIKIPQIGPATADQILEHRKNKTFETLEELKEIKGISGSKYKTIIRYLKPPP